MLNLSTGEWDDDDEHPLGGDVGEQAASPLQPMPPPPIQAPGPELTPPAAAPPGANAVMPPSPSVLPAPVPSVAPYAPQMPPPIPVSRAVQPAEAANLAALDRNTQARFANAQDQGNLATASAQAKADAGQRQEDEAARFVEERQRIADDATKRIQERQAQANADYEEFKKFGIKDPQANDSFVTRILKAIMVGLGGYAAGINGGPNSALEMLKQANADNIARQKAEREKLFQISQRSKGDIGEAAKQRDDDFKQLDLKHSALLESSAAMLRGELGRIGIPQAQIDANADVQKLEQQALAIREQTLKGIRDDEVSLAKADISASARRARAATGAGGGGGAGMDARAELADYAQANPGDTAGLYRLAAKRGLAAKDVAAAVNQNKVTEGAGKEAGQGAVALRAIDAIEKANYAPGREDIQKWLANQRDVARAASMSEGKGVFGAAAGGLANLAQSKGLLAQNEFDGLSPKAKEYFTNVRRYMETIGRVQSGAAISASEWGNFYGQYGPQSEGGLEAARQFARDRFRMSGVAGRVLEQGAGGAVPAAGGGKGGDDPRVKLAREAIADPNASRAVKAKAVQILRSLGQADIKL